MSRKVSADYIYFTRLSPLPLRSSNSKFAALIALWAMAFFECLGYGFPFAVPDGCPRSFGRRPRRPMHPLRLCFIRHRRRKGSCPCRFAPRNDTVFEAFSTKNRRNIHRNACHCEAATPPWHPKGIPSRFALRAQSVPPQCAALHWPQANYNCAINWNLRNKNGQHLRAARLSVCQKTCFLTD